MAEAILNGLTSNKHRLLKEKLTEQRDKLFHMSQQQQQQQQEQQHTQQEQEDKVSESDEKHPTDHQTAVVTATGGADVKEEAPISIVSTIPVTSVSNTNLTVTTTDTTSAVSTTTCTGATNATTTTAAAAATTTTTTTVCSQADKEK